MKIEKILLDKGMVKKIGGEIAYTGKGKRIKNKIEDVIRYHLDKINAVEIEFPTLVDYEEINMNKLIKRGRQVQCIQAVISEEKKLYLARTCEEFAASYFFSKKNNNETIIYQIKSKYRNENELSFLKRREFTMADIYSYDKFDNENYNKIKNCIINILNELKIDFTFFSTDEGEEQGITSEEVISIKYKLELGHLYKFKVIYSEPFDSNLNMYSFGLGVDRLFWLYLLNNSL